MSGTRANAEWWRAVLGEYPTGVTLITSTDESGEPVGMVVGSLVAVSQDPPLIGFLPDATSTTFPTIARTGRFAASVLGAAHEQLVRAFVRKDPNRFAYAEFTTTDSGILRPADAIAWFDATIVRRDAYGDHDFVVGQVDRFGAGTADAGLPLLFRRGGYGRFAVPDDELDAGVLARKLRSADRAGDILLDLARELDLDVLASAVVRDSVVVLTGTSPAATRPARRRIGAAFPFAAPISPAFVAWADDARRASWIEGSRHLVGAVDRPGLQALLEGVRRRGYAVSSDHTLARRFEDLVHGGSGRRESFARLWSDIAAHNAALRENGELLPREITAIQAPVFGPDAEVELVIAVNGFDGRFADIAAVDAAAARILQAASAATERIGGIPPASD